MAHYEPPHQDLRCLQIQLHASLVLEELTLLHSERPKLYAILSFLSALGLRIFLSFGYLGYFCHLAI